MAALQLYTLAKHSTLKLHPCSVLIINDFNVPIITCVKYSFVTFASKLPRTI